MAAKEKNKHARQVSVSRVKREDLPTAGNTVCRIVAAKRSSDAPTDRMPQSEAAASAPEAIPLPPVAEAAQPTASDDSAASVAAERPTDIAEAAVCQPEPETPIPEPDCPLPKPAGITPEIAESEPICVCTADVSESEGTQQKPDDMPVSAPEPRESTRTAQPEAEPIIDPPLSAQPPVAAAPSAPDGKWYIPQKWKEISPLRKIIMILSAALFVFSCIPLFIGVLTPGVLPPACIALFFFGCALYWPLIDRCDSVWGNIIIAITAVLILMGITYLSFVSGKMISASTNTLPDNTDKVTVVVLGCKINGDQPSRMLQARLETAAEFLLEHPQAHCIVTGGKGEDEDYPEALIMKNYLVSKGVSSLRIIVESTSTSTLENITNAAELARRYNCHERFLIVTDRFHQYRAITAANSQGIVSYALNVETVWYLAMHYWFREMAAITRDWITA